MALGRYAEAEAYISSCFSDRRFAGLPPDPDASANGVGNRAIVIRRANWTPITTLTI